MSPRHRRISRRRSRSKKNSSRKNSSRKNSPRKNPSRKNPSRKNPSRKNPSRKKSLVFGAAEQRVPDSPNDRGMVVYECIPQIFEGDGIPVARQINSTAIFQPDPSFVPLRYFRIRSNETMTTNIANDIFDYIIQNRDDFTDPVGDLRESRFVRFR